jgi:hypothetical protein
MPVTEAASPVSHISVETGHFYPEDLNRGPDFITECFQHIARWANVLLTQESVTGRRRISTCIMVDAYGNELQESSPQEIIGSIILPAAKAADLSIDYIGLEAGFVPMAQSFLDSLVAPTEDFKRPPLEETKWLPNLPTRYLKVENGQAMQVDPTPRAPQPLPAELLARHKYRQPPSVYVDVELCSTVAVKHKDQNGRTVVTHEKCWACPTLAAMWQLARLGGLDDPAGALTPQLVDRDAAGNLQFGDTKKAWGGLPVIMQVNKQAAPFRAYRSFSFLPPAYMEVESAVRDPILAQFKLTKATEEMHELAAREGIWLPPLYDRLEYCFDGHFAGTYE